MELNPQTGNEPVGDAAPQNATTVLPAVTPAPEPAQTPAAPAAPVETDAERGLRQAAEAERKKRQDLEALVYQQQVAMAQMAQQMRQPQQPASSPEPDPIGFSSQDLLDPENVRKALIKNRMDAMAAAQQSVAQIQFQIQYPDFDKVAGSLDPATAHLPPEHRRFVPSPDLQEALNEDPYLMTKARASGNPQAYLYDIAKKQKRIRELLDTASAGQQRQQQAAARSAANTAAAVTAPMSPSAVGGPPANLTAADSVDSYLKNVQLLDSIIRGIQAGKHG